MLCRTPTLNVGQFELHVGPGLAAPAVGTIPCGAVGPESASGVAVTIPSGHGVGASEANVVAANSAAPFVDNGFGSRLLHYDVAGGIDYESYGGSAWFEGGAMKSIVSPLQYYYDC